MIIPIRCFTCGKPIAQLWEEFNSLKEEIGVKSALDKLEIKKYCCRSIFLGHVDLIDITGKYKHA